MELFTLDEMKTQIVSLQTEVERLQMELQIREELLQNLVSYVYSELGTSHNSIKILDKEKGVEFSTPVTTIKK
jgi:TolA-binding protein